MNTIEITLNLPEDLAERARKEGLLGEEQLASLLQDELRRQRLFAHSTDDSFANNGNSDQFADELAAHFASF